MDPTDSRKEENSFEEWQIDSPWVNLPSSSPIELGDKKANAPAKPKKQESRGHPTFQFIPAPARAGQTADWYLVMDQQPLRLSETKSSGHTHWVCSIPLCTARCTLDPTQSRIVRFCREHNHETDVNRQEYQKFIHALKTAVRERPHMKPKLLYEFELERARARWLEKKQVGDGAALDEPALPSFEAVHMAMCITRKAVLSSLNLRPSLDEDEDLTEDGASSQEGTPGRNARSTRSARDGRGGGSAKKKLLGSKFKPGSEMEEVEDEWPSAAHMTASLSDLEDWLEDDVNANIAAQVAAVRASRGRSGAVRLCHGVPGRRKVKAKTSPVAATEENDSQQESLNLSAENLSLSEGDQNGTWDGSSPLEAIPKRKYRKRPASSTVFSCPHCPYKSNRHFNVQRHERLAHSTKKPEYSCKECGTSYSLEYRLKLHIKAVHQGEGHHCTICNRTFETMTGLKSHQMTKHKNEDLQKVVREPAPELTCNLCGRVFSTRSHLQKHQSSHVMVQPFRCCVCNQAFMEEAVWLSHQASCQAAFTLQCCLCSAFLPTASRLMLHMDEVHGRAEYSCACGKGFPWKKSLLTHQQKCSLFLAERPAS